MNLGISGEWQVSTKKEDPASSSDNATSSSTPKTKTKRGKKRKSSSTTAASSNSNDTPTGHGSSKGASKATTVSIQDLEWIPVAMPSQGFLEGGDDGMGGFYGLEEMDGVDCVWTGDERTGRVCEFQVQGDSVKSKKRQRQEKRQKKKRDLSKPTSDMYNDQPLTEEEMKGFIHLDDFDEANADHIPTFRLSSSKPSLEKDNTPEQTLPQNHSSASANLPAVPDVDVGAWAEFNLKAPIMDSLKIMGFTRPTPIQSSALPLALARRDVIGVAATGSGKTLAYGIPIVQHLLRSWKNTPKGKTQTQPSLAGLILTPTRELATQVKDHLVSLAQCTPQPTHILPIVGGMSIQKQERVLARHPHIIVATPGRLWELMEGSDDVLLYLRSLSFLVIDEADRMFETGHFRELTSILKALSRRSAPGQEGGPQDSSSPRPPRRQTFVFSATLGKDFLSSSLKDKGGKKGKGSSKTHDDPMNQLLHKVEFDDPNRQVVDVTTQGAGGAKASTLLERRVDCVQADKEALLYYFLLRFPARTLVFVNSIDAARRILPSLQLLRIPAFGLHGQMQQRARLRSLDRFRDHPHGVLLATDVAARGLDIPEVEHVIHYQVPRTKDTYIHRSGRTARAGHEGLSTLFCGAEEVKAYKALMGVLGKGNGLAEFPVDRGLVTNLRERVTLARKINEAEHKVSKVKHEEDWMRKQAEAMDIILDDSMVGGHKGKGKGKKGWVDDEEEEFKANHQQHKVAQWKAQLEALLGSSVIPRGSSAKYPTSGHVRDLPALLMLEKAGQGGLRGHKKVSIVDAVRHEER